MTTPFRTALLTVAACLLVASYSITGPTEKVQVTPDRPVGSPPLTGWNINVVEILESGNCLAVEKRGNFVYASFKATLSVFDISDPSSPVKVGHTMLSSLCWDMARSGDYLYCMLYPAELLEIVDVSDPTSPQVVASVPADGYALAIEGNYLYHEQTADSMRVLDISTPANPVKVGSMKTRQSTDIVAQGGYVYTADFYGGLRIIDATDPSNPVEVALHPTGFGAQGVDISGTYAYVVNWLHPGTGFYVVDVSNPSNPVTASFTPACCYGDVVVEESYAYLLDHNGSLDIFDVTNPANPVFLASCDVCWPSDAREMSVSDGVAAVATGIRAMCLIDVSNPFAPTPLGYYESLPTIHSVDIANGYLALSSDNYGYGGLLTINPYDTDQRYWTYATHGWIDRNSIAVRSNYAYLGNCNSDGQNGAGLAVVDVTDPTNMDEIGWLPVSDCIQHVAAGANYVYVSYGWGWIILIDVSDPTSPTAVGELPLTSKVNDIFADDPYLYVANSESGLKVVDVSDPTNPTVVGSGFSFNGDARGVWVSDGYAYVTGIDYDHEIGLWILDITDPLSPSLVATFATAGATDHVRVRDSYLYLQSDDLFQILDITNPAAPTEVGNIAIDLGSQIAIVPPYIYAIGTGSGLLKLQTKLVTAVAEAVPPLQGLMQNHPNPFSSSTTIDFVVQRDGPVELAVFDVQGRRVATLFRGSLPAGPRSVTWDGRNEHGKRVGSGIYFCRLRSNASMHVKKMVVAR